MATAADYQRLQEAANTGEWLESRLHLMFTEIADNMFGDGRLTREERKTLSAALGAALDALRGKIEAGAAQLYTRKPWQNPEEAPMAESGEFASMFVPLLEKAVRRDGTIPVKIIEPGWGTTGYYPAEVLERDGPKVFKAGTQMFWNHATPTEEMERPEGDLNDLAAVLTADARWDANGPAGAGLYADAKVFEAFQKPVDELAPHIGVSIRAHGQMKQGEAEGRRGPVVQSISTARSVDFVTKPGAGGQIVAMFEAARVGRKTSKVKREVQSEGMEGEMSEEMKKELQEAQGRMAKIEQENARLREALLLREASEFVGFELGKSTLPDVTKGRLVVSLAANPPVKDGQLDREAFAARIEEAVKAEIEYLAKAAGYGSGRIAGMGGGQATGQQVDEAAMAKRLSEGFAALGLSEKEVAHAVHGR